MSSSSRKLGRVQQSGKPTPASGSLIASVTRRVTVGVGGRETPQFVINLGELAPPDRRYSAEEASVSFNGVDAIYFIFVQRKLGGEPRSLVTVKMYSDAARQLFDTFSTTLPELNTLMERMHLVVPEVRAPEHEPAQSVAMLASLAQVTFAGFEAEMRFYHVSPYAIHMANQQNSGQVSVEPVVQVDLPTSMLVGALKHLEQIVPKLPRSDQ